MCAETNTSSARRIYTQAARVEQNKGYDAIKEYARAKGVSVQSLIHKSLSDGFVSIGSAQGAVSNRAAANELANLLGLDTRRQAAPTSAQQEARAEQQRQEQQNRARKEAARRESEKKARGAENARENPQSKTRFSAKRRPHYATLMGAELLAAYNEESYNRSGWAYYNEVMTPEITSAFQQKIAEIRAGSKAFKRKRGGYIVEFNVRQNNVNNGVMVFTDGKWASPSIDTVVIFENADVFETVNGIKEDIYEYERRGLKDTVETAADYYGEILFRVYHLRDFPSFQEQKRITEGSSGTADNRAGRTVRNRGGSDTEDSGSLSGTDGLTKAEADYLTAAQNGDEETCQKYIDRLADQSFPSSKIRDEDGRLIKVYHGSDAQFTVFDPGKSRSMMDIQGSFFSPLEDDASGYGSNVNAFYLKITNPADEKTSYAALRKYKGQNNAGVKAREYLESLGYDGVDNGGEEYLQLNVASMIEHLPSSATLYVLNKMSSTMR